LRYNEFGQNYLKITALPKDFYLSVNASLRVLITSPALTFAPTVVIKILFKFLLNM
jgi:hypothetical protein